MKINLAKYNQVNALDEAYKDFEELKDILRQNFQGF